MIHFFVPGKPRSTQTGSVVRAGGRAIPLRRNAPWSAYFGLVARQHAPARPMTGALRCTMRFWFRRPKRRAGYPTSRPDAENLPKGLLDAVNGVLWEDDSQIIKLEIEKVYAPADGQPGVEVFVEPLPPDVVV